MARPPRQPIGRVWGALSAAGLVLVLSACGQSGGQGLAQQACAHVTQSLHDFAMSNRPGTPSATATSLRTRADQQLRQALPLAAAANSADGSWNSLMTTISEGATIDEVHIAPALKAQCAVADTPININPE